jgi:hypothetical protein
MQEGKRIYDAWIDRCAQEGLRPQLPLLFTMIGYAQDSQKSEAVRLEREGCAQDIESMEPMNHHAGQWEGYRLGKYPCVGVSQAAARIRARASRA